MDKTLLQWAQENKVRYATAYNWYRSNKLPAEAYKNALGNIYVRDTVPSATPAPARTSGSSTELGMPRSVELFSELSIGGTSTRFNKSAVIEPIAKYANLDSAFTPFESGTGAVNGSTISIREAIILCVKAYYSFSPVRLIIDTITEFSSSPIYFTGNNKQANKFFESLFKTINFADFVEQFFLEFYRSGNCFVFRQESAWKAEDVKNLNKVLGSRAAQNVSLPVRYIVINPAEVEMTGTGSFIGAEYKKVLTDYELARLKDPKTEQDLMMVNSLPTAERQKLGDQRISQTVTIPLDPSKLIAVFHKKMTYEPFAVPPLFPLLDDLEFKSELKRLDRAVMRTIQNAVLHIKVGYENKAGDHVFSQKTADALQTIFENETVSRVLVTDFSVALQYIIPEISDILDPKKYEIVNADIREGLNNIVFGSGTDEKFSNTQTKVRVFIEKIRRSREAFLSNFLIPEVKRISKLMGFKSYPTPHFEDIDIENEVEYSRMITRLAELGFLTADETFQAIETGRLPTPEESLESQQAYKANKDKGLYQPMMGGPADQKEMAKMGLQAKKEQINAVPGRPSGSKAPKKKSKAELLFSTKALTDIIISSNHLFESIAAIVKDKHKLKELNDAQRAVVEQITESVMANETSDKWKNKKVLISYIVDPVTPRNKERIAQLEELKGLHGVDNFVGCLLLNSSNLLDSSNAT